MRNIFLKNKVFILLHILFLCIAIPVIFLTDKLHLHLFFNGFVNSPFDSFFKYITYIGDGAVILLFVLVLLFFDVQKALVVLICYGVSTGFTQGIKYYIFEDSDRPQLIFDTLHIHLNFVEGVDVNIHHSFPSGHTTAAFSLFFCLSLFYKNNVIKTLCFISALLVSFSRVYLSQHFFEDITVGSMVGAVFSFLVCFLLYQTKLVHSMNKLQKPIYKLF